MLHEFFVSNWIHPLHQVFSDHQFFFLTSMVFGNDQKNAPRLGFLIQSHLKIKMNGKTRKRSVIWVCPHLLIIVYEISNVNEAKCHFRNVTGSHNTFCFFFLFWRFADSRFVHVRYMQMPTSTFQHIVEVLHKISSVVVHSLSSNKSWKFEKIIVVLNIFCSIHFQNKIISIENQNVNSICQN